MTMLKERHIVQNNTLVQYINGIMLSKLDEPEMEISLLTIT